MFSQRFLRLTPYTPGEQPQDRRYIKLNTNENPYPPSPGVRELLGSFDVSRLGLYPDPVAAGLRDAIAGYHGVARENVFVGNGSDEVLSFSFYAFYDGARGPLLFPSLTFSFYPVFADFHGIPWKRVPLRDDFSVDLECYLSEDASCGVIFANPNAPTGLTLTPEVIGDFLRRYPGDRVVIVDEAYVEFGGKSVIGLLSYHPNLLIVTTCSKSRSLAGGRLGYAIGSKELVDALFAVKNSFNSYTVNVLTQEIGRIAFLESDYYRQTNAAVARTRDSFVGKLSDLGWRTIPSSANFVLTRKTGLTGAEIYDALRGDGILVRYFDVPGIDEFVRVSIGTDGQMERVAVSMASLGERSAEKADHGIVH